MYELTTPFTHRNITANHLTHNRANVSTLSEFTGLLFLSAFAQITLMLTQHNTLDLSSFMYDLDHNLYIG